MGVGDFQGHLFREIAMNDIQNQRIIEKLRSTKLGKKYPLSDHGIG